MTWSPPDQNITSTIAADYTYIAQTTLSLAAPAGLLMAEVTACGRARNQGSWIMLA